VFTVVAPKRSFVIFLHTKGWIICLATRGWSKPCSPRITKNEGIYALLLCWKILYISYYNTLVSNTILHFHGFLNHRCTGPTCIRVYSLLRCWIVIAGFFQFLSGFLEQWPTHTYLVIIKIFKAYDTCTYLLQYTFPRFAPDRIKINKTLKYDVYF